MFYSDRANVNNQYLTNVFCVAKTHGLNLPVYQINFCNKNKYKGLGDIKCDAFVLMICGNENHESVEHYLSDSRVKMIVKNYPRMLNITDGNETGQTYETFLDQTDVKNLLLKKKVIILLRYHLAIVTILIQFQHLITGSLVVLLGSGLSFEMIRLKLLTKLSMTVRMIGCFIGGLDHLFNLTSIAIIKKLAIA